MFGGLAIILIILGMLVFGGKSAGGELEMKAVIDETGESLGIISSYESKLDNLDSQNDIALVQIILRGNYQNLGDLYIETYKAKKSISSSPRADEDSLDILDAAVTNDTIDTEIFKVLSRKILSSNESLSQAKSNFSNPESLDTISTAQNDFESLTSLLNKNR